MNHKPAGGAGQGERAARAQEIGLFRNAADPPVTALQRWHPETR